MNLEGLVGVENDPEKSWLGTVPDRDKMGTA